MKYSNNSAFNPILDALAYTLITNGVITPNEEPTGALASNYSDLDSFMADENLITEEEYLEDRLAEEVRKNDELESALEAANEQLIEANALVEKQRNRLELGTDVVLLGDKKIRDLATKVQRLESNLVLAGQTINAAEEYIQELEANRVTEVTIVSIELGA